MLDNINEEIDNWVKEKEELKSKIQELEKSNRELEEKLEVKNPIGFQSKQIIISNSIIDKKNRRFR